MPLLDNIDRQLLTILQADASLSIEELAERVGLTKTPCWRRVQKLEKSGIIRRKVVLLNAEILGLPVSVFILVKTNQHDSEWSESFATFMAELPEVVACHRMAGEYHYLLHAMVRNVAAYDHLHKQLICYSGVFHVASSFAMEQIKNTTELPIPPGD